MAELDRYTQKAVDDPDFRARVLEDANKAIKEEFGYEPPYKVTYHIADKNHIVFCLPPDDGALDDNDVNNVAGGVGNNAGYGYNPSNADYRYNSGYVNKPPRTPMITGYLGSQDQDIPGAIGPKW